MSTFTIADLLGNADKSVGGGAGRLPVGEYDAFIERATTKPNSSGNPSWGLLWKVESGPHAGETMWSNLHLTPTSPQALGIFFRQMAALGLTEEWLATLGDMHAAAEPIRAALEGRRARIKVEVKKGTNGYADREEVKYINPPRQVAPGAPAAPAQAAPAPSPAPAPAAPAQGNTPPAPPF